MTKPETDFITPKVNTAAKKLLSLDVCDCDDMFRPFLWNDLETDISYIIWKIFYSSFMPPWL